MVALVVRGYMRFEGLKSRTPPAIIAAGLGLLALGLPYSEPL